MIRARMNAAPTANMTGRAPRSSGSHDGRSRTSRLGGGSGRTRSSCWGCAFALSSAIHPSISGSLSARRRVRLKPDPLTGAPWRVLRRATIVLAMRYHIWTEGCQMNEADSEKLAAGLARLGWQEAARAEDADLAVVNTCVVRQKAEDRAAGYLGRLQRLKGERE